MSSSIKISQLSSIDTLVLSSIYIVALDETDTTQGVDGSTKKVLGQDLALEFWSMSADYITPSDLTFVAANSALWQSSYSTVNSNSATTWNYQGNDVKSLSSAWQNSYNTVNTNSSVTWNYQGNDVKSLTSNWQNSYNAVNSNSATTWNYQGNDVKSLTSNWQNSYTGFSIQSSNNANVFNTVQSNSGTWGGGGGGISTPRIYYVSTNGNDGTGAVGNPSLPYLTGTAAWTAGQNASEYFIIEFGKGEFTITCDPSIGTGYMIAINGHGMRADSSNNATKVSLNTKGDAGNPNGGPVSISISNLLIDIDSGGHGWDEESGNTGGNGGAIAVTGFGQISIQSNGGDSGPGATGGNGGNITLTGALLLYSGGVGLFCSGGSAGLSGSSGTLAADGCDLRNTVVADSITLGRCSYLSGLTIANDKGGNAAY